MNDTERDLSAWAERLLPKVEAKLSAEVDRVGDRIPYLIRDDGRYNEKTSREDIHSWTNGFWPGMMWQMYQLTGDGRYLEAARGCEERLDEAFDEFTRINHDTGFVWSLSAVADYRLTGNAQSRARGLHAATILAGRYNPAGQFFEAFNAEQSGWMIIDTMMNLPLLYWASGEVGDPHFRDLATRHADTTMRNLLRGDGSTHHVAVLDTATGDVLETPAGQGYAPGSSWTRGQSWAVYGFALSARATGRRDYLDAARRAANYVCANAALCDDVLPCDFQAPSEPRVLDTSATCVTASGLLELAGLVGEAERGFYVAWAHRLLKAVEARHVNWDPQADGIVQDATVAYETLRNVHLVYSDFYFIEALLKACGRGVNLWLE